MYFKNTVIDLLKQEENIRNCVDVQRSSALPEKCYFIDKDTILCYPRTTGDSRYPYSKDGFTLWAYSSGYMSLNESTFYYILPADEGKEPYVNFYGGIKSANGFTPVSITGVARQPQEDFQRFTVFTPQAVYYITKTENITFALRAFVSNEKKACFSVCALNHTDTEQEIYLSAYFNCLLMHQAGESVETKWFKQCSVNKNGFLFESVEDLDRTTHLENYGVINRDINAEINYMEHTTSRSDYTGGKTICLNCSTALFDGYFGQQKQICKFGDTSVAGDIISISLKSNGFASVDYVAEAVFDKTEALKLTKQNISGYADKNLKNDIAYDKVKHSSESMLKMEFGEYANDKFNGTTLTNFVHNVQRQVEFAALAKNSGVSLLGVRDVAQQLEAALMWNCRDCRSKIIEVMNFIDPSGRAPRQYSLPAKGALPQMDTRAFIDQGNWLITTIYQYLAFTDDYTILDELCGYYKITGKNRVQSTEIRDSILDHLLRITDYLINNIDEQTHCLKALYGDWNDALDGLGVSGDPNEEYGSGVSVMATLQLYKNLSEMTEILSRAGDKNNQLERYKKTIAELKRGLLTYAIETTPNGRRILHGWGDKYSYKVGSNCDIDGKARFGLTANAYWAISGAYLWDTDIKSDILTAYTNLDSKYGLKTFEPYFEKGTKGVGRIVNLPKGTAENSATYIHATLFGIWSLFEMGEGKLAWEQLEKVLPLTHKLITTTPFVMSNSYSYNEELGLDGESMSDWFTGSANVLIKTFVREIFGISPDLEGVTITPCAYIPFNNASISISAKNKIIKLHYCKNGSNKRTIRINGKSADLKYNDAKQNYEVYLRTDELLKVNTIEVFD